MSISVTVLLFIAALIIIAVLKVKLSTQEDGLAFQPREVLFTPAERSFLGVLEQALDSSYRIFGKVRLGDIVKPAKGLSNSRRTTAQNKINQKHVDFVICKSSDLTVVMVVELDDKSHERDDRVGRDQLVDRALAGARIPVIHFSAQKGYALPEVLAKLAESFAIGVAAATPAVHGVPAPEKPASAQVASAAQMSDNIAPVHVAPAMSIQETAVPVCPKCEAVMVKRQASKGPHAGKYFWACSAFPKCRQVLAIEES
ncbi:MAG TPA: DUF2726 domain-containing protein [Geobacteraceae bacterium]